jgi:hypothetical protein
MAYRSKVRGQMTCRTCSFKFGIGRGTNNPSPEKCTVTKPVEGPKTHTGL